MRGATSERSVRAVLGLLLCLPLGASQGMDEVSLRRGGPVVRVGIALERESITLSSKGGLKLEDGLTAQPAGLVPPGGSLLASVDGSALRLEGDLPTVPARVPSVRVYAAVEGAAITVAGRPYRGSVELRVAGEDRVSAINILPLEDYLLGVVPLEIGPRGPDELAAVEAQAVAARTYAVAQLGGQVEQGFDLFGSVDDQAYGGLAVEREESTRAVRRTAGMILLFEGRPIRAYYHSTCGGRTAPVEEVMDRPPAPYLRSVSDRGPDGVDYCSASPRYTWTARWSKEELDSVARIGLAAHFGVSRGDLGRVEGLAVVGRTPSGRVEELAFHGAGLDLVLSRLDIRRALPYDQRILNSTNFSVAERDGGLVELNGRGYGHGAGMCQWGAIGRARAGQEFEQILKTYYPGAVLVKVYRGEDG
ncbi:MAG: SpoIID/LytB domain-containing protein [Gemmatimonadetes bacterium]|nr:SpoIID/LytB domain-containing protein [Gemmatimonadota bacterium]